jgi:serine/threonine protein phosphatase 1
MARRFVIPDIHGCSETFSSLLRDVINLRRGDTLYLLGDMIDRGPGSKRVIDAIMRLRRDGFAINAIRGNHEEMLLRSHSSASDFDEWMMNGGRLTLASFNATGIQEIPYNYRNFLLTLPYYIVLENFILVHSCLNFDAPDPFADIEAMLWERSCTVQPELIGGRRVISGHTPVSRETLFRSINTERIMLDNGCVYRGRPGYGCLAALDIDTMEVYFKENID